MIDLKKHTIRVIALFAVMFGAYFVAAPFTSLAPFIAMLLGFLSYNIAGGLVDYWRQGRRRTGSNMQARPEQGSRASSRKGPRQRTGRRTRP